MAERLINTLFWATLIGLSFIMPLFVFGAVWMYIERKKYYDNSY